MRLPRKNGYHNNIQRLIHYEANDEGRITNEGLDRISMNLLEDLIGLYKNGRVRTGVYGLVNVGDFA
jgi:hypothetical protein